jgi:hypothetical protein
MSLSTYEHACELGLDHQQPWVGGGRLVAVVVGDGGHEPFA